MTALLYPDNPKLCRYSQAVGFLTEEFLPAFEAIDLLRPDGHDVIRYVPGGGGGFTNYSRHRTTRKRGKTPGHAYLKTHRKRTPTTVVYVRLDQVILRSVTGIPKGPFPHSPPTVIPPSTSNHSQPRFNHETLRRKPRFTRRKRLGQREAAVAMDKKHRNDGPRSHRGIPRSCPRGSFYHHPKLWLRKKREGER